MATVVTVAKSVAVNVAEKVRVGRENSPTLHVEKKRGSLDLDKLNEELVDRYAEGMSDSSKRTPLERFTGKMRFRPNEIIPRGAIIVAKDEKGDRHKFHPETCFVWSFDPQCQAIVGYGSRVLPDNTTLLPQRLLIELTRKTVKVL